MTKKLVLTYIGRDGGDRPVYECEGHLYVDVEPRSVYPPKICTKYRNEFDGEPLSQIADDVDIEFIPKRDTWNW